MNNIPSAGERAHQEANRKKGEIAASVTDKSVAQLVSLTALRPGGNESASAPECQARLLPTQTHAHIQPLSLASPEEVQREDWPQEGTVCLYICSLRITSCRCAHLSSTETLLANQLLRSLDATLCFFFQVAEVTFVDSLEYYGFSQTEPCCPVEEPCVFPTRRNCLVFGAGGRMEELSGKDKELIRGSWESLGKNKVPHGVIMFSRLFELDPALLSLFHYSTNCDTTQDCVSSPEFLEHVTKVMLVIDAAVSHLDDLQSLEDFLLNLGRKHQAVGVSTQSFAVVGESLLYMLQCSLGQAYTAPLRQAWLNMYSIVVAAMSRGWAKNGEDKAD